MSGFGLQARSADEAEVVFYEAFMRADINVMSALWANEDVVCVHPGSGVISGYEAVLRSWRHILENTRGAEIRYKVIKKSQTDEIAVHVVTEEIVNNGFTIAVVISTNVYQKFPQGWLMVEHHGSVMQQEHQGETIQ